MDCVLDTPHQTLLPKAYSEPSLTSMKELSCKKDLTDKICYKLFLQKYSTIDFWLGAKHVALQDCQKEPRHLKEIPSII